MKALLALSLLIGILLAGASVALAAPPPGVSASAATTPTWPYTLYGNALEGWGLTNSSSTITSPGPVLTVTTGEVLSLQLVSTDGITHNWFVDVNNNSAMDASEPHSANVTHMVWYNLTVSLAPGTYTYRCAFHPSKMWGELVVNAAPTFTLWGSAAATHGWGFTSTSITYPGPTLTVAQGQTVTVDLFSADGADHTFYVDFARSNSTTGNTVSSIFNGTHAVRFTFAAGSAGNFTYACGIHGALTMKGTVDVTATSTPPAAPPNYGLYAAAVVIIVIVAIAVVVVIRRKPRTPPSPPETPPSP